MSKTSPVGIVAAVDNPSCGKVEKMEIIRLAEAPAYDPDRVVARPLLAGSQSNVRHPPQRWPGARPTHPWGI